MQHQDFLGLDPAGFHKIHYTTFGKPSGEPPILCLHGVTRNGRDFDVFGETGAAQGRFVLCLDLPGRGESDWLSDAAFYTYQQYLSDITTLIALSGGKQVDIVGTSMGGSLGMLLAAQKNSPVRRLIINDIGPKLFHKSVQRIADYLGAVQTFSDFTDAERYIRKIYAPFALSTDEQWRNLAERSLRRRPDGSWIQNYDPALAQIFKNLATGIDFWSSYDQISCPTLVLRGASSDVLSTTMATEMSARGPKPHVVTFDGVGHAPALQDAQQIRTVMDFLK